jgi:hypothetical protein
MFDVEDPYTCKLDVGPAVPIPTFPPEYTYVGTVATVVDDVAYKIPFVPRPERLDGGAIHASPAPELVDERT